MSEVNSCKQIKYDRRARVWQRKKLIRDCSEHISGAAAATAGNCVCDRKRSTEDRILSLHSKGQTRIARSVVPIRMIRVNFSVENNTARDDVSIVSWQPRPIRAKPECCTSLKN